ncbi:MAG: rRNA maturation RNase YbeY [Bdellovibrionales bacterium]|nr:rRNA maturation RNase YbeY [Bdellovibrionales bacterium]
MKIQIINNSKIKTKIKKSDLTAWVHKVCDELNKKNIQLQKLNKKLTLVFVNEQDIQALNKQFRKKNSITDILSFAPIEEHSLGEIILCLSFIYRTTPGGFSNGEWLYYLILHGMLHLLGFEHESKPDEARKMYHLQDAIFRKCISISHY